MRALVIGAGGFVGRWLVRHLLESGDTVDAIVGPHFQSPLAGVDSVQQVDVRDGTALAAFAAAARPGAIYYLAGVSQRGLRDSVEEAVGVSVVGCLNTLTAAAGLPTPARLLYPSTGYVYKGDASPLREDAPLDPAGLYASAKLAAEVALQRLSPSVGVDSIVARAFNHTGPGQTDAFLVPAIARQVAAVAAGSSDVVRLGPSSLVRDFCDVRDVVRAYRLLMLRGEPGLPYNVASGLGVKLLDLVHTMMDVAGVSARVESSATGDDHPQPAVLIGDPGRVRKLGWRPTHELRATLADVFDEHHHAS